MAKSEKPKTNTVASTPVVKVITPPQSVHVQNSMPKDSVPVKIVQSTPSNKKDK